MGLNDTLQNVKGKFQSTKGEAKMHSSDWGTKAEGLMDKTKGKLNESMARNGENKDSHK